MEIVAQSKSGGATEWKVAEGAFVSPPSVNIHTEL
jgi:DNA-binding CsgD family transcriptional regulator